MAILNKAVQQSVSPITETNAVTQKMGTVPLDPKLSRVKEVTAKGDYQHALEMLTSQSQALEYRNSRAVCLIRLHRFEEAIGVLRTQVLDPVTLIVRSEIPTHVKVNFAIALFYGGMPAGAFDVLNEIRCEEDPSVQQLRNAVNEWVSGMSFLRKLDWKLNRIAPKTLPTVPQSKLGQFIWDVA